MIVLISFIQNNWIDLLLVLVGLSAIVVYFIQRHDRLRSAATLIICQVDSIEKSVSSLKSDFQLGNVSVFHSKKILEQNMWEEYKHLFVKRLSRPNYNLVQEFFDNAEQLERARTDIINLIVSSWNNKSITEHGIIADYIKMSPSEVEARSKIDYFENIFRPLDIVYIPNIAINSLTKNLNDFRSIIGTSAYETIQKISYSK